MMLLMLAPQGWAVVEENMAANHVLKCTILDGQEYYLGSNREKCSGHVGQPFMVHLQQSFSAIRVDDNKTRCTGEDTDSMAEGVEDGGSMNAAERSSSSCISDESTASSQCLQSDVPASPSAPPSVDAQNGKVHKF